MTLELDDIQSGILRPRPTPYAATYLLVRIDDPIDGRRLMQRASELVASAASATSPDRDAWVNVGLTFQGLRALGVPQASLDSFPPEFQQGMAARAAVLGDTGESAPAHWEAPLGTPDVHVVFAAIAPDAEGLAARIDRALKAIGALPGLAAVWREDCHVLASGQEPFGFMDGVSQPAIEGSGIPGTNPDEPPLKPGEFVLGYPDELGGLPPMPTPEVLGRNGTYAVLRKVRQRVAAFRQFLKESSANPEEEEWLAAKMMGRWRSGAPLALSPEKDDPALGADPTRNNAFLYRDDSKGYKTPPGSHIRRANPRDALGGGDTVRIHRVLRRRTTYGPPLPEGALEDDGADRGQVLLFIGAHLRRQFEFVQSVWLNDSEFIGAGADRDPIASTGEGGGGFTIPRWPVRRRVQGLSRFVVTRGGEYCFMPGLRALRWLAALGT
ncbi:peroxidase [Sorangium sp. So ce296]|uniref:Dyp-type peroxidase n=1 Tax=Sorangium sp. So ce296 TaxID=3133296 RepID=UPI003F5E1AA8